MREVHARRLIGAASGAVIMAGVAAVIAHRQLMRRRIRQRQGIVTINTARIDSCDARITEILGVMEHLCSCLGIRVESEDDRRRPHLRLIRDEQMPAS